MFLLTHDGAPIGICIFGPVALNNGGRWRAFGGKLMQPRTLNRHFTNLSRVVIDPRYRGAGIASDFIAVCVANAPARWVELVTSMGKITQFYRRGGFVDYGALSGLTVGAHRLTSVRAEVVQQSQMSRMRYYLADRDALRKRLVGWRVPDA